MATASLTLLDTPRLRDAPMLLALTGWMDGGLVSTGTVQHLMEGRELVDVARISQASFYIDNFPGSMDIAALFLRHVNYDKGLVDPRDKHRARLPDGGGRKV